MVVLWKAALLGRRVTNVSAFRRLLPDVPILWASVFRGRTDERHNSPCAGMSSTNFAAKMWPFRGI